jgi:predicted dehydrogenase
MEETMKKLRIGVIGAGFFATRAHIPALQQSGEAEVVAICRRNPEALAKVAGRFDVPEVFTDYRQLLEGSQLDAAVVSSPHALHYTHTKAALERGLPVLTDKPLAVTHEEAEELRSIATRKGLPVIVAFGLPYQPAWRAIREWIAAGELGSIHLAQRVQVTNVDRFGLLGRGSFPTSGPAVEGLVVPPTTFRASAELGGGGYFQDVGSHAVGGILVATGLNPVEVVATMDNPAMDLRATVVVRCDGGAVFTSTTMADAFPDEIEYRDHSSSLIVGSRGSVSQGGSAGTLLRRLWNVAEEEIGPDQLPPRLSPAQHLVDVLQGRAQPIVPLERAATAVRVIEAAYASAREGRAIRLD